MENPKEICRESKLLLKTVKTIFGKDSIKSVYISTCSDNIKDLDDLEKMYDEFSKNVDCLCFDSSVMSVIIVFKNGKKIKIRGTNIVLIKSLEEDIIEK